MTILSAKCSIKYKNEFSRTMQAYADVRKQLNEELSVKNHVINDTTNKLEEHQDALCCLKEELAKTKKRMVRSFF